MRGFLSERRKCYPTTCPECGEPVFFYHDENDGRVFFDKLGDDWPKHYCLTGKPDAEKPLVETGAISLIRLPKKKRILRIIKAESREGRRLKKIVDSVRAKQTKISALKKKKKKRNRTKA